MAFGGVQQGALIILGQGAQGVRECRTDSSPIDALLHLSRKSCGEGITTGGPGLATTEQMCGGCESQPVIVNEGRYDARFIHGGSRARRCIGTEKQRFVLRRGTSSFDHGRSERVPVLNPARQALEAVNDFERTVLPGCDADREFGCGLTRVSCGHPTAQAVKAGAQKSDGDVGHHGGGTFGRRQDRRQRLCFRE